MSLSGRRVVILLVVAVLVIGAGLWVSSNRSADQTAFAQGAVLPGLEGALNTVNEVRLTKADKSQITLKKRDADWVVVERDYPADSGRVRKLLLDLAKLKSIEEKTSTPANYPALGVEDLATPKATGTLVEAVTPEKTFALIVGKPSGMKTGYVRVSDAKASVLAEPQLTLDVEPQRWVERTIIDIPQERVQEVAVAPTGSPAYVAKRETREQTDFVVPALPKGRTLESPTAANASAGGLAALSLDDIRKAGAAAPATGEAAPAAEPPGASANGATGGKVTYKTFDGLVLEVTGRSEGTRKLISIAASSTADATKEEAGKLQQRLAGWEYEIPTYKFDALFRPLEQILASKP